MVYIHNGINIDYRINSIICKIFVCIKYIYE